jgi:hypothetical protein
MYELVKRILDKSREAGVDVLVAYDMVAAEIGHSDELKKAKEIINTKYDTITKCRRLGDNDAIKTLCDLIEEGNPNKIRAFEEEIEKK